MLSSSRHACAGVVMIMGCSDNAQQQEEAEEGDFPRVASWYHIMALGFITSVFGFTAGWTYPFLVERRQGSESGSDM